MGGKKPSQDISPQDGIRRGMMERDFSPRLASLGYSDQQLRLYFVKPSA